MLKTSTKNKTGKNTMLPCTHLYSETCTFFDSHSSLFSFRLSPLFSGSRTPLFFLSLPSLYRPRRIQFPSFAFLFLPCRQELISCSDSFFDAVFFLPIDEKCGEQKWTASAFRSKKTGTPDSDLSVFVGVLLSSVLLIHGTGNRWSLLPYEMPGNGLK